MIKIKKTTFVFSALGIIALGIFIFLLCTVLLGVELKIDRFGLILSEHRTAFLNGSFKIFTHAGSVYFMSILAVVLLIFMRDKKKAISLILVFAIISLLNVLIKYSVLRERPSYMLIDETGKSFPSAHAMISIAFYGYIIYMFKDTKCGKALVITLSVIIALLGFSRVYLGVHYLTDVLAGWAVGFAMLVFLIMLSEFVSKKAKHACKKE